MMVVEIKVTHVHIDKEGKLTGTYALLHEGQVVADATFGESFSPKKFEWTEAVTNAVGHLVFFVTKDIEDAFVPTK